MAENSESKKHILVGVRCPLYFDNTQSYVKRLFWLNFLI